MPTPSGYALVRVNDDSYRLDSTGQPRPGAVALIARVRDRLGGPMGWKLKPILIMQGSKSRIWLTPAEAVASTRLMTPGQAKAAVKQADMPGDAAPASRLPS